MDNFKPSSLAIQTESKLQGCSTGPRTGAGKRRARLNATKHAIFASGLVLPSESEDEFRSLLEGLREDFRPSGTQEELLVDRIAELHWRRRRVARAEAELLKQVSMPGVEQANEIWRFKLLQACGADSSLVAQGILFHREQAMGMALETLKEVRKEIEKEGPNYSRHREALRNVFLGTSFSDGANRHSLIDKYRTLVLSRRGDETKFNAMTQEILDELSAWTELLSKWNGAAPADTPKRTPPSSPNLVLFSESIERLVKYETAMDRGLERAWSELERLQRLRAGQPVPPPIKVDVSQN